MVNLTVILLQYCRAERTRTFTIYFNQQILNLSWLPVSTQLHFKLKIPSVELLHMLYDN